MTTSTITTRIDSTINNLTGGLVVKKGAELVGKWAADLENAEWRGAKTIHEDLIKLHNHLENETLDPKAIGELLVKLGESTGRVAGHAEGATNGGLERLSQALVKAGEGLRG